MDIINAWIAEVLLEIWKATENFHCDFFFPYKQTHNLSIIYK